MRQKFSKQTSAESNAIFMEELRATRAEGANAAAEMT
jgi:hypothetical protein